MKQDTRNKRQVFYSGLISCCLLVVACYLLLVPVRLFADIVILKNGSIFEGKIIEDDGEKIILRVNFGKITLKHAEIKEIEKADFVPLEPRRDNTPSTVSEPGPDQSGPSPDKPPGPSADQTKPGPEKPPTKKPNPLNLTNEDTTDPQKAINELLQKIAAGKPETWKLGKELASKAKEELPYFLKLLENIEEPTALRWIIYVLGQTKESAIVEPLLPRLNDENEAIRRAVINALANVDNLGIADILKEHLKKEESAVIQISIINTLARLKDNPSIYIFIEFLGSKNNNVRSAASNSLVKLYTSTSRDDFQVDIISILRSKLMDASIDLRKEIVNIFGQLKDPAALDILMNLLTDEDPGVRSVAAMALGNMAVADKKIIEFLVQRMDQEEDLWTRMQIIQALQKTKDYAIIPIMIEALRDPEKKIRLSAARALRAITKRSFGSNYEPWKKWWDTLQGKK